MRHLDIRAFLASVFVLRDGAAGTEILLLCRAQTLQGAWCQCVGKIEAGETAWQAGLRELSEETGLVPLRYFSGDILEEFYEPERDAITIGAVFVAWVAPDAAVHLNEEHSDHRWVDIDTAMTLVEFAGQRRILCHLRAEFIDRTPSPHLRIAVQDQVPDQVLD